MRLSLADTVRNLFGVDLADCTVLKDKANSFVRKSNGLVKIIEIQGAHRKKRYLQEGQDVVLFNALLLNAVFHDPKHVKSIFENQITRSESVPVLKAVLLDRSNLCGVALTSPEAEKLVKAIEGDWDLRLQKLPNPFSQLPQVVLGSNTNLLQVLLAQATALDPMDSILMAYLKGDIEQAYTLLDTLPSEQLLCTPLAEKIMRRYNEASDFDDLLDQMRQL